jgi:hypothetical protein
MAVTFDVGWVRVGWVRVGWVRVGWVRVGWARVGWVRVGWVRVGWVRVGRARVALAAGLSGGDAVSAWCCVSPAGGSCGEGGGVAAGEQGGEDGSAELTEGAGGAGGLERIGDRGDALVGRDHVGLGKLAASQGAIAGQLGPSLHSGELPGLLGPLLGGLGEQGQDHVTKGAAQLSGGHRPGNGGERVRDRVGLLLVQHG